MDLQFIQQLIKPAETKIVLLVLDGLGGLSIESHTLTALEAAHTPCLDALASRGICGLHQPVAAGITPGSGPAHLALFGFDPLIYRVGRGVLEALGIDFELAAQDVAARGNFCTLDSEGKVTDRRAGRISTETNKKLCALLREIQVPEADILIEPIKEHRMLVVLQGDNLSEHISDTDPQMTGKEPLVPEPLDAKAEKTSHLMKSFVKDVREKLSSHHPANMLLLRGFSKKPSWPSMEEVFGMKCAAIAAYPMYRGLAKLVGMQLVEVFIDRVQKMDKEKQEEIAESLSRADKKVTVHSAWDMSSHEKQRITKTLRDCITQSLDVDYQTSPEVILGIEVRTPASKIAWNIEDYLESLESHMARELDEGTGSMTTQQGDTHNDKPSGKDKKNKNKKKDENARDAN